VRFNLSFSSPAGSVNSDVGPHPPATLHLVI
jgi:hypothetical protein